MQIPTTPLLLLSLSVFFLAACQSDKLSASEHQMSKTPVCQECYDAVAAARRTHPVADASTNEIIETYACPCCETEMSVYIENGTHMVKCGGCASEGIAWDQCRPVAMSTE